MHDAAGPRAERTDPGSAHVSGRPRGAGGVFVALPGDVPRADRQRRAGRFGRGRRDRCATRVDGGTTGGPAGGSGPEHAGRRRAASAGVARPAPHPGRRHDAGPAAQRRGLRPGGERGGRPEHRRAGAGGRHPGRRAAGDPVPDAVGRARHVVVQLLARPGDERRRRARRGPGGAGPLPHRRCRVRGRGVAGPADPRGGAHGAGHARRPPDAAGRRVRRRRLRAGEHALPRGVPARLRPREHPGRQRPAAGAGGRAEHPGLEAALGDDPAARRARRAGARHAARRRHQRPGLPGDGRVPQRQHQRRHRRREQPLRRTRRNAVHGAVGRSPRPARGLRGRRRCPEGEPPRGGAGGPARLAGAVRLVHRDRHGRPGARARSRRGAAGPRRPAPGPGGRVRGHGLPAGARAGEPDLPAGVRVRAQPGRRVRGDARGRDAPGRRADRRRRDGGRAGAAGRRVPACGRPCGRRAGALPVGPHLRGGGAAGPAADPGPEDRHPAAAAGPGPPTGRSRCPPTSGSPAGSPAGRDPASPARR